MHTVTVYVYVPFCGWYFCCSVQIVKHNMQDEAQSLPHAIFIYGTLKRGQPNHDILQHFGICKYYARGCTELKYPLIIDTEANLPFMLDAPGKGQVCSIFGYKLSL